MMLHLLDVNTIAFTVLGYPLSYVEFAGTIFYLWSVWLIARRRILTWPVGILSVLLYMVLFYQVHLYSDTLEQVYYLGASIYGWIFWNRSSRDKDHSAEVTYSGKQTLLLWAIVTGVVSIFTGMWMSRIHLLLPALFPAAASFPFLDALTTIMSFTAMGLMARKKVESWVYWIVVDAIGIWLYFVKEVKFIALLYVVLLFMAISGLRAWHTARAGALSDKTSPAPHCP